MAAGMLLIAPVPLLGATLVGLLLAEVAIRREPLKLAYNMGNFATSTSVMIATYHLLAGDQRSRRAWTSVGAMLVALTVFAAVNLGFQAELNHITNQAKRWDVIASEWKLSAFMVVGGVGVGMTAVYLWLRAPALLPIHPAPRPGHVVRLQRCGPARAGTGAQPLAGHLGRLARHSTARGPRSLMSQRRRSGRSSVPPRLSSCSPTPAQAPNELRSQGVLSSMWADPGPRALRPRELPDGWQTGVVTRLDLGHRQSRSAAAGLERPIPPQPR